MADHVILLGTLDTKPAEVSALQQALEAEGLKVKLIDVSLRNEELFSASDDKLSRMARMADITAKAIRRSGALAVVGIGGGTGSEIAFRVMAGLPLNLPKFMITTMPFDPRNAVADNAIILIPTLCDVQGLNAVLRQTFTRTAAMVSGVVNTGALPQETTKSVAVTMLGVTQAAGEQILEALKANGHETCAFHAAGYGGAALARFADEGLLSAVIDMTVSEIVRMHIHGSHAPMPNRFSSASNLPRVVLPGAINFMDCGAYAQVSEAMLQRPHYRHSSYFTHVKLTEEEVTRATVALAEALNQSTAPCEVLIPMGGFSSEDRAGGAIEDPSLRECVADLLQLQARAYSVTRLPHHINDPVTASEAVSRLLSHL